MVRGDGCCILSWPRVRVQLPGNDSSWPGWSWLMALWGYMLGLASQGLPRTSLEVCKLILAMTLPYDPTHSLAHLDYFALRAEEYDFLLHFVEHFNPPCALPAQCIMRLDCCLPNFAYSAALAYYLRTDGDACEASALGTVNVEHLTEPCWVRAGSDRTDGPSQAHLALLRAMLFFPGTLRSILDNLGISLNSSASGSPYKLSWSELLDRSPLGQKPTLHQQHFLAHALVSDAFVQRCAAFFRGERMLRWLHACAGRLVQMCESSLFEKELLQARKPGVKHRLPWQMHSPMTTNNSAPQKLGLRGRPLLYSRTQSTPGWVHQPKHLHIDQKHSWWLKHRHDTHHHSWCDHHQQYHPPRQQDTHSEDSCHHRNHGQKQLHYSSTITKMSRRKCGRDFGHEISTTSLLWKMS